MSCQFRFNIFWKLTEMGGSDQACSFEIDLEWILPRLDLMCQDHLWREERVFLGGCFLVSVTSCHNLTLV